MISPAQYQYIKDVLGITQVIVPEGFQHSPEPLEATGSSDLLSSSDGGAIQIHLQTDSPVALLTNHALNQPQKALALKILKAVGIGNPSIVEINQMNLEVIGVLEQSVAARWFVYFEEHFEKIYGTIEKFKKSQVLYTFSLDSMLEGDGQEIQTYKRQVWNHMKLFSKRWEES